MSIYIDTPMSMYSLTQARELLGRDSDISLVFDWNLFIISAIETKGAAGSRA